MKKRKITPEVKQDLLLIKHRDQLNTENGKNKWAKINKKEFPQYFEVCGPRTLGYASCKLIAAATLPPEPFPFVSSIVCILEMGTIIEGAVDFHAAKGKKKAGRVVDEYLAEVCFSF